MLSNPIHDAINWTIRPFVYWIICLLLLGVLVFGQSALHAEGMYELVDIQKIDPKLIVAGGYCGGSYSCGHQNSHIFLLRYVARRLSYVREDLAKEGLGLVVYEGYRSPSAQNMMSFGLRKQCTYPEHYCKGMGVDVSIFYLDGSPIQLPSCPGHEGETAYRAYPYLPPHVFHNTTLLETIMWRHGFVPMRERWWHFDARGYERAPFLCVECQ